MAARAKLLSAAFFLAMAATALAQRTTPESRGEAILARHCAMCHAIGRAGSSPHAAAPPFRTLAQRYPLEALEEALGEGLMTGHPEMPEFVFPPHEINAILAYLRSIQDP